MNRRKFLTGLSTVLGLTLSGSGAYRALIKKNRFLGSGKFYLLAGHGEAESAEQIGQAFEPSKRVLGHFVKVDLATGIHRALEVPIFPHGFAFSQNKELLLGVQKWGDLAVISDTNLKAVWKILPAPADTFFSGHGLFADRDRIVVLPARGPKAQGQLLFYDLTSQTKLARVVELAQLPHDVHAIDGARISFAMENAVVESDSALKGSVQLLDMDADRVSPIRNLSAAQHILPLDFGRFAIGGSPGDNNPLSLSCVDWRKERVRNVYDNPDFNLSDLRGEALSLTQISQFRIAVTCRSVNQVAVWDIISGRYSSLPMSSIPLGVCSNGDNRFFVNDHQRVLTEFLFIEADEKIEKVGLLGKLGNGHHLYKMQV